MTGPTTLAVLTDFHFGDAPRPSRRAVPADDLLERAVDELNTNVRPDVTVVLGDVVDDGESDGAKERLQHMHAIFGRLDSPLIAIPGNHDGDERQFYGVFSRPAVYDDIAGVRFVCFVDREEPGWNASRSRSDLDRLVKAREGYDGPLVTLQHVCLFRPGTTDSPFNYTNADEVIDVMISAGVTLSLSGHHHSGTIDTREGGVTFINAPGMCERPFPYLVITLTDGKIRSERRELEVIGNRA